jgi:hypothetical protein
MKPCPNCGQPLHEFEQPSWRPDSPAISQVECHNVDCDLHMVTMTYEQLLTVDPASYRAMRQGLEKRGCHE